MDILSLISSDLDFDNSYGDMVLVGDQVHIPNSKNRILKQGVIDRVKSNFNNYPLNGSFGANLDSYIGKGLDQNKVASIESAIRVSLTNDSFLSSSAIEIYSIILKNDLYIRIYILTPENTRITVAVTSVQGDLTID